ncbi:MAG: ATPase [Ruminococcaceae bacterium]|nr:ATPase [Oscillospiraceae bacterium]
MSIENLLDEIEDVLDNSKNVMFSSKVSVDADELREIIKDIRLNMPDELTKARKIATERKDILDTAQNTADGIIEEAHKQAAEIISEHAITKGAEENAAEIIQEARTQATEILEQARGNASEITEQARKWATDLRTNAGRYVENIVITADEALTASVNEIRKARMSLRKEAQNFDNANE